MDGVAFGLSGAPMTLVVGTFEGNTGDFTLASGGSMAGGAVTISSCNFVVTASTFPLGSGPQGGDHITIDPCQVDAIDGRLMATRVIINTSSTSAPPTPASPNGVLMLPASPPTLVTDENTPGTVSVGITLIGDRPGALTFNITGLPAHGTARVDNTGLVTYQPDADFNGSDRLVVTAIATFTDGNAPPSVLGTVRVPITVQPVSDIPALPPHTARVGSPLAPVTSGTTFTVPVQLNAETTNVISYLFELTFDHTVVIVTNVSQGSSLFEAPITNPAAFASGAVRFAANNPTFAPASGLLTLANITFQVIGNPGSTSPLTLQFPANGEGVLVDSAFQAIGGITFADGSVTVN